MKTWLASQSRFITAVFFAFFAIGTFAMLHLPVSLFPTISFPRLSISLDAGDQPADQMVVQVTRRAEEALRAIPGVSDIRSQSSRGSADISISFDWGQDMVVAALQAESVLSQLSPVMPQGYSFNVRRMDPTIFPVLGYSVTSDKESLVSLKNFALYELRPLLASLDGVAEVTVLGGREQEFQVLVDPVRLQALGLSALDVEAALSANNNVASAGLIEDRSRLFLTLVDDRLRTAEDIGAIILKTGGGGVVELNDVAEVRLGVRQEWTRVTADGQDAVLVNIRQAISANSLVLTDDIKNVLARAAPSFPPGVAITPYYDQSDLVRQAASSVRDAILIGTLLAGLILFLFLRSIRFVLAVAILLPSVLASAAILLTILGQSLNIMTLGGMAAAVGLIVDDIVVMLEHISRRLSEKSGSAPEASQEMLVPMIGSSLSSVVVFAPLAFLSGVTGGFFKALALTMAAALILSLIFSVTVVPLLAHYFARPKDAERAENANAWLRWLERQYVAVMRPALRRARVISLALLAGAAIMGGWSARQVASGFMPPMDEGGFVLDYVAPPGLSLTNTDRLIRQIEEIVRATSEVESYSRRTGLSLGGFLSEANEGDFFVRLKHFPRRSIEDVMSEIRGRIVTEVPGVEVELIQLMGDLIGDLTAVPQPIEIKLYSTNAAALADAADSALKELDTVAGVVETRKSDRVAGDAILIKVDRPALSLEGLDPVAVSAQLQRLVGGANSGFIQKGERTINIRIWTAANLHDRVAAIKGAQLHAPDGRLVPLDRIASIDIVQGQRQISRENLQPMTAVTGRLEGRDMGSAMRDVRKAMAAASLPAGIRYEFGGLYAEQQKSFRELTIVFGAAFLLSSLLLILLFREVSRAVSILLVVGLSVAGVMTGLVLTGTELNISSMMGLTMIIGIIAELGVFYFAEIPHLENSDESRIDAGRHRMRPILMSALVAILALSPIAMKFGEGAALLAPMAVAIISGLTIGAPMVLLAAPLFYAGMQRRRSEVATKSHPRATIQKAT